MDQPATRSECHCGKECDLPLRGSRPEQQFDQSLEQGHDTNFHRWHSLKCSGQIHSDWKKYSCYTKCGVS